MKLLQSYKSIESTVEYVKNYANEDPGCWDIIDIFADVDEYVKSNGLSGYHCTKQAPTFSFALNGLRTLDFTTHHAEFRSMMREHPMVDEDLFRHIDAKLTDWQANHTGNREKKLWFCLTRTLVLDSETESFFKYFGGEAIYFAFLRDQRVAPLLESIGEPVIVEAKIDVSVLTVSRKWAFGRTLVSHFAAALNPNFFVEELEGYVSEDIPPQSVVAVHSHNDFVASLTSTTTLYNRGIGGS
ncbi:MAG: hypothetical protein Q8K68_00130 [Nitrospirota bacterium]|nr:hypothetical protein [Nitrospirota bacterium]